MIKNTCPNSGTPSPGLPAEWTRPDAGLAVLAGAAATVAIMPAASASTGTNIRPYLGRIGDPHPSVRKAGPVRSAHHRHGQYLPDCRPHGGGRRQAGPAIGELPAADGPG